MTTIDKTMEKCTVCGQTNEYEVISTTNVFGPPDLDTRPSEMERSTINMWIQTCPSCGYCAPAISEQIENSSAIINSSSYLEQLNNAGFPKLANAFLCSSLIQESIGKYHDAGWSGIHAAWVCDDDRLLILAQTCRRRAIHLLQKAQENNQEFAEGPGMLEIIITDLLRRSSQFEEALKTCNSGLAKKPEKVITGILHFEKKLIGSTDNACHSYLEVNKGNLDSPTETTDWYCSIDT